MGFGITGIVNALKQKALIRYVPANQGKTIQELEEEYGITGFSRYGIVGAYASIVGDIQQVIPDVRKAETERLQSEVNEYALEDGSVVAQHIIQRPVEVVLYFEETNAGKFISNVASYAFGLFGNKQKSLYDQIQEIWRDKIPVEIVTDQNIYKNMVIASAPITQKAPYKNAIQVACTFKQLTTATPETFSYKGATAGIDKAASTLLKGGRQFLKEKFGD